jgi:lipopolysaccharide export system permease protein
MLNLIDRQMMRNYFKSYIVCLSSLLLLYVVVDLFTNLDDFAHSGNGLPGTVKRIGNYYAVQITLIFDRLSEAIALLAAMFTIAWMQRSNEQMPLLSAGVSTHRIVAPVVGCAFFMILVSLVNQEVVIPAVADRLTLSRDDPGGQKEVGVRHAYDPSGIHVTGLRAVRHGQIVRNFECLIPDGLWETQEHICAQEARYVPCEGGPRSGHKGSARWELTGCHPPDMRPIPGILEVRDRTRYVLYTRTIDFDSLTREPNWFLRTSTWQLYEELQRPESTRLASMAVLFHTRLTRPLLGFVLVLMGLSVILRDQNRNVFISAGMCLVLCAVFFASCTACKMLGDKELLTPALAAWLPVLVFGPFAFVLFDAAHT